MYIIIDGATYDRAARIRNRESVTYIADGIPDKLMAETVVKSCRDDGFLLCEDDPADYARQISRPGVLTLTNEPVIEPADPAPTWAELAGAITEGVESI